MRFRAAIVAGALGGRRSGRQFVASCPAHHDRSPSLSIADGADGKLLVRCHAGCAQDKVIAALRDLGLWNAAGTSVVQRTSLHAGDELPPSTTTFALSVWNVASPAMGTLGEVYLRGRGITLQLPATLRFHGGLKHSPTGTVWPALLALITSGESGEPIGISRTFLLRDGSAKAPIQPAKMMLGRASGGAVQLRPAGRNLMVGEGIETCLSVIQASGAPVWAALSASGLRSLQIPFRIENLTILADGDEAGETAAQTLARRVLHAVRTVRIARPDAGTDFNDLLQQPKKGEGKP